MNFSVSAGFNINCRDIATGQTALHVALCDLEFDDDDGDGGDGGGEHGGASEGGEGGLGGAGSAADRLVNACRFLLDRGADPLLADDKGNSALHYACHLNDLLGPLRLFLRRLSAAGQQRRALQPNAFGNSALHYALQQPMEDAEDAAVIAALMRTEGAADAARQPNLMGLTPPQLFRPSATADPAVKRKVAALLGMTEAELLDASTPTRPRVDRRRVCPDVTQGQEAAPVEMTSEFHVDGADILDFKVRTSARTDNMPAVAASCVSSAFTRMLSVESFLTATDLSDRSTSPLIVRRARRVARSARFSDRSRSTRFLAATAAAADETATEQPSGPNQSDASLSDTHRSLVCPCPPRAQVHQRVHRLSADTITEKMLIPMDALEVRFTPEKGWGQLTQRSTSPRVDRVRECAH